jgi:segregation and condensation protein A
MAEALSFGDIDPVERRVGEPSLHVDVDGFEGPLYLLLELAQRQKVDLSRISILALAEQYLAFVEEARRLRLELAADYLVMAAWLAFLKSRLLLPEPATEEAKSGADPAVALALRLQRLETIREAARRLGERDQLALDVFSRGRPEAVEMPAQVRWEATLHDLLTAYAGQRRRTSAARVTLPRRRVWSLAEARAVLERLVGRVDEWAVLDGVLFALLAEPGQRATVLASALSATLEMVREGRLSLRQDKPYGPVWIRSGPAAPAAAA